MKIVLSKVSKVTLCLAVASVISLVPAGAALADPPNTLQDVRPHRHMLVTPNGERVPIGPNVCTNADLQQAFNQFHYNVHHTARAPGVDVATLGPQHGAPGLHDGQGAELMPGPCA